MFAKTPIEPNAVYTREETAQLLGISLSTLKQLIRTGQLRVSQPAGLRRVFIRGTSILDMIASSERNLSMALPTANSNWHRDAFENSLRAKQSHGRERMSTLRSRKTERLNGGAKR